MIRILLLLVFSSSLLVGCYPVSKPVSQLVRPDQLSFAPVVCNIPQVVQRTLDNGMRVYLQEDDELPLVELTLVVGGGSIRDPAGKVGLANLFAGVLETGGTENLSPAELETELEELAIELSVSGSRYSSEIDISLHSRDLTRGIEILAELLTRPGFDHDRLVVARQQLLESIRRRNDDPDSIAARLLAETIYQDHPFGSFPQAASVKELDREDLLEMHQQTFRPDNVWLAVSGAVELPELLKLLQDNFASWQPGTTAHFSIPDLPLPPPGRILVVDKAIPQTSVLMGHKGIDKDNPDLFALRVANYILGGGGFNSRLMREVRSNKGLAYSVYSYFQLGRRLPELFITASETKSESTVEVVKVILALIQQIIDEPVTAEELDLAKQSLINSFVFAFCDTHSVVSRQVRLDFFDYPEGYLENYRDKIAAVTIADVQRVARKYLHPDQLQIVLVGDKAKFAADLTSLNRSIETIDLQDIH